MRLNRKYAVIATASVLLLLIAAAVLILPDRNSYSDGDKTAECSANGLIFSITAYDGKSESGPFLKCLGHVWLALKNGTGQSVCLEGYEILPGETVTFSVWAMTKLPGVIFNLEPHYIDEFGRYSGRRSVSVNIDPDRLKIIEEFIEENSRWKLTENCSYWCVSLWNAVVGEEYGMNPQTLLYTPERLLKSIAEFENFETDRDFSGAGEIFVCRDGTRTELELCQ